MSWLDDAGRKIGELVQGVTVTGGVGGGIPPSLSVGVQARRLYAVEHLVIAFVAGVAVAALMRGRGGR